MENGDVCFVYQPAINREVYDRLELVQGRLIKGAKNCGTHRVCDRCVVGHGFSAF